MEPFYRLWHVSTVIKSIFFFFMTTYFYITLALNDRKLSVSKATAEEVTAHLTYVTLDHKSSYKVWKFE